MENSKPTINVPVVFEKTDATGTSEARLTLFDDGSVYLDGADGAIFEEPIFPNGRQGGE